MTRKLPITLAAILAGSALALPIAQPVSAEDAAARSGQNDSSDAKQGEQQPAAEETPAAQFPAGVKLDDDPKEDQAQLTKTLDNITEAAFTKGGFDDVVQRLVDQDRNRIGKDGFAEKTFDDLDAMVEALRTAWKDKYKDDFEVDGEQAFAKLTTIVGEIDDPKAVASAWPVPAVSEASPQSDAVPAAAKETDGNADPNLDSNVEKGRDVAIATVPASHGLPALNVSLVQELQGWRIDVPNTLTGQQLHDSLLKHLTHVTDAQAQWPADKNEAAAMVAHHVLLAAYGVDVEPGEGHHGEADKDASASPAAEGSSK
jgi:hypothetical protein